MGSGRNDQDWRDNRNDDRGRGDERGGRFSTDRDSHQERGFFDRAGDEISSWFGNDEAERRREMDERMSRGDRHPGRFREGSRDYGRDANSPYENRPFASDQDRDPRYRDDGDRRPYTGRMAERGELLGGGRTPDMDREQHYRPMTGDYGRSSGQRFDHDRPSSRAAGMTGDAASGVTAAHDRHYGEWRQRQIDELDRDYDEYRREHQSKFESDFSNWRSMRQAKRQLLGQIKEHMQVVGSDEQPVGIVDKVRGDRLILTKNDGPDGQHHSVNCAMIDRVDGDRVVLDKNAEDAKAAFGSEERDRALFERDDNREPGAHILNRSFSGTY